MKWRYCILLLVFFLGACNPASPQATLTAPSRTQTGSGSTATPSERPTAVAKVTHAPDPKTAAEAFLSAWQKEDYASMYAVLSNASKPAIAEDAFTKLYQNFAQNLTLQKIDFLVNTGQYDPYTAKASFQITYHTSLFKDLQRQNEMEMVLENGSWRIKWDDGLPMPEMRGGNHLALELTVPGRGEIQDRNGNVLAGNMKAAALGVIPGDIVSDQQDTVTQVLGDLTGRVPSDIQKDIDKAGPDWYVPVGTVSENDISEQLKSLEGVQQYPFGPSRFYPYGGVGPHITGYVQMIPKESEDYYLRQGIRRDEWIGASGLEKWGQNYLSGTRGANLYLFNSSGAQISRLAQVQEEAGQTIVSTIDMRLQRQTQLAMREFRGAVVVLERNTGKVLAMVSSVGYDPNNFNPNNFNSGAGLEKLFASPATPLVNRATGDQASGYPLGSVFKIIDMAAALESGTFTAESTYDCQYEFNEIVGRTYYDWTKDKDYPPSGVLTLPQGLMRSCNPWFYHIGLTLFNEGRGKDIANMARGFGLGSPTGLAELPESAGTVPEPSTEVDAVEQAIGQGQLQVTPLQVADFIAAIGNGGTLYKPELVEKIVNADGTVAKTFEPQERGKLPIKPETLDVIQQAMHSVIASRRGTAYDVFTGFNIPLYGKTGTAQSGPGLDPHAWFAAYTDNGNPDRPDIAVVAICETAGEGSEYAAPIVRRVLETYFFGKPIKLYPWEEHMNVTKTETPTPEAPQESPTETPAP
jgi:cell division protein FtsI/penicillin-binding protein 2